MAEPPSELQRRKWPLYTWELTPLCDVPDELWSVIGPILHPEENRTAERPDPYPWLSRLDPERSEEFIDYCVELDCCHEEFEFAAYDLETAADFSYSTDLYEEDAPHYRRLALIYHSDNVDHRIYAYREKVFQLVSLFFGGIVGTDRREDPKGTVKTALGRIGHREILALLNRLENDRRMQPVADALKRRRTLVHALAIRRWKTLQARRRITELVIGLKVGEAAEQLANLEALIKERRAEIEHLCEILATFRQDLTTALKGTTLTGSSSTSQ